MTTIQTSLVQTIIPDNHPRRSLLTPLPTPGEFLLVLDNSSLEKFTTCPLSARNYLVLGREAHARNAALTFGGAIHGGLEALLKGEPDEVQDQAIVNHFANNPCPPDEYRTPSTALEVLKHYRQRAKFPDYNWTILSDAKGLLVERAFELPLGVVKVDDWISMPWFEEPPRHEPATLTDVQLGMWTRHEKKVFVTRIHLAWSGRMDVIAHANNMNRVVDHKTTSIAGDQVIQDFHLSNQTVGYVWAARQLWPDLDIRGFAANFIHLKKPTKGSTGLMDKGPRGGEPSLNFFRAYFEYSPDRLAQWVTNVQHILSDFIHSLSRGYFPAHTKWCFGKYGACPYHVSCVEDDPRVRDRILQSDMFKPVTWNPLADR